MIPVIILLLLLLLLFCFCTLGFNMCEHTLHLMYVHCHLEVLNGTACFHPGIYYSLYSCCLFYDIKRFKNKNGKIQC